MSTEERDEMQPRPRKAMHNDQEGERSADPIALMEKLTALLMGIVRAAKVAMTMAVTEIVRVAITAKGVIIVRRMGIAVRATTLLTRVMERPILPLRMGMHRPVPFARDVHA